MQLLRVQAGQGVPPPVRIVQFQLRRALDEQGDGVVYARCPKKDGLSMAVYNRLIRAAAFRVIDL